MIKAEMEIAKRTFFNPNSANTDHKQMSIMHQCAYCGGSQPLLLISIRHQMTLAVDSCMQLFPLTLGYDGFSAAFCKIEFKIALLVNPLPDEQHFIVVVF
jgi:hypothetical protein